MQHPARLIISQGAQTLVWTTWWDSKLPGKKQRSLAHSNFRIISASGCLGALSDTTRTHTYTHAHFCHKTKALVQMRLSVCQMLKSPPSDSDLLTKSCTAPWFGTRLCNVLRVLVSSDVALKKAEPACAEWYTLLSEERDHSWFLLRESRLQLTTGVHFLECGTGHQGPSFISKHSTHSSYLKNSRVQFHLSQELNHITCADWPLCSSTVTAELDSLSRQSNHWQSVIWHLGLQYKENWQRRAIPLHVLLERNEVSLDCHAEMQ